MKLKFIFLGKKSKDLADPLINLYIKRLRHYNKLELIYFADSDISKLEKKISQNLNPNDYLICLDENGTKLSTLDFKRFISEKISLASSLVFLVGNAYGIPKSIVLKSKFTLSLSSMTLPHMIARTILLEQTYRVFTILNNHPYHHE